MSSPRDPGSWFRGLDRVLKWLKWPALALVLWAYSALHFTEGRPFPYMVQSSHYLSLEPLRVAVGLGNPAYLVRIVIFIVALLGALLVVRFWCRYLCPLGAVLGLLNHLSLFKMGIVPERCRTRPCGDCLRACPMATTPSSTDCTWCTDCMNACKDRAIVVGNRLQRLARRPGESIEEPAATPVSPRDEEVGLL